MRLARLAALFGGAFTAWGFQAPPPSAPGIVAGRVVEAHSGDPARGIRKALVILRQAEEPGIGVYTDDKGNYRLQAAPGAYSVRVERDGYVAPPRSQSKTITVQAGQTAADVNIELVRTGAVTDDRGVYRIFQVPPGKYYLSAAHQSAYQPEIKLQLPEGTSEESYGVTYFPGTPDLTRATAIDVPVGGDLTGFDLQLQRLRAVHIRGRISGMAAAPIPLVFVAVQPVDSEAGPARDVVVRDPGGEFDVGGVAPGKYVLSANSPAITNRGGRASVRRIIEVGQADVDGIQLTLAEPQAVNGVVVTPTGRKIPQAMIVMLSNRPRTDGQSGAIGEIGSDGAFTLEAVSAGDYDLELGIAGLNDDGGADLYVSAIRRGDEDVLAHGLHVSGGGSDPLEIVLKANGGTVEVTVRTPGGDPFPEASVALLPDPPRRDQMALYGMCMTDARGVCTLRGIAPGDYHVLATSKDAGIDFRNPSETRDLEKQAKALSVAEGDRQTVEIELAPDGQ